MSRRSIRDQVQGEPAALARRPSKAKRDRSWEQQFRGKTVTFRDIPPRLRQRLNCVAAELGVTASEVGRAFLEYGLGAYERGELELRPEQAVGKLTLYLEERG